MADYIYTGHDSPNLPPTWESYNQIPWVPYVTFGGASVGVTYAIQTGGYTKIGSLVFFHGGLVLTSKGVSVGDVRIEGLPFVASAAYPTQFAASAIDSITLPAGRTYTWYLQEPGTDNLVHIAGGSGVTQIALTDADWTNTSQVSFTGFYFTV